MILTSPPSTPEPPMNPTASCVWLSLSLLALATCPAGGQPPAPPPEVEVARPVTREVTDHQDFLGHTEPSASVRLKARVSGYLDRVLFKDGEVVKQGDVLFEIDPRPYRAAFE